MFLFWLIFLPENYRPLVVRQFIFYIVSCLWHVMILILLISPPETNTDFWICPLLSVFNDAADWVLDFTLRVTDAQSALWNPDQLGCIRCGSEWNSLFIASAVKHRRRTVLLNNLFQHINFPKYINVYCRHIDYNVQYIYIYDRVIVHSDGIKQVH